MTLEEHTLMLILLDLLSEHPNRAQQLLTMAYKHKASERYKEIILTLSALINEPDLLLAECRKIRKELF